jgi:hypothetical protein
MGKSSWKKHKRNNICRRIIAMMEEQQFDVYLCSLQIANQRQEVAISSMAACLYIVCFGCANKR